MLYVFVVQACLFWFSYICVICSLFDCIWVCVVVCFLDCANMSGLGLGGFLVVVGGFLFPDLVVCWDCSVCCLVALT